MLHSSLRAAFTCSNHLFLGARECWLTTGEEFGNIKILDIGLPELCVDGLALSSFTQQFNISKLRMETAVSVVLRELAAACGQACVCSSATAALHANPLFRLWSCPCK